MTVPKNNTLIGIIGPTASGKTALAVALANVLNGEIISADSRQVYKNLDIGTGKDLSNYTIQGKSTPYHLINICEPGYKYSVYEFQRDFFQAFSDIITRKHRPILCGGSGLYIEAVLKKYKLIHVPVNEDLRNSLKNKSLEELESILRMYKKLHNVSDTDTKKRAIRAIEIAEYYKTHPEIKTDFPFFDYALFAIKHERNYLKTLITKRLHQRIAEGLMQEVQTLLAQGISPEDLIYYGLEYKFVTQYLLKKFTYDEMFRGLNTAIHRYAKRQMTWFRRMERNNFQINWIDGKLSTNQQLGQILFLLEKTRP